MVHQNTILIVNERNRPTNLGNLTSFMLENDTFLQMVRLKREELLKPVLIPTSPTRWLNPYIESMRESTMLLLDDAEEITKQAIINEAIIKFDRLMGRDDDDDDRDNGPPGANSVFTNSSGNPSSPDTSTPNIGTDPETFTGDRITDRAQRGRDEGRRLELRTIRLATERTLTTLRRNQAERLERLNSGFYLN